MRASAQRALGGQLGASFPRRSDRKPRAAVRVARAGGPRPRPLHLSLSPPLPRPPLSPSLCLSLRASVCTWLRSGAFVSARPRVCTFRVYASAWRGLCRVVKSAAPHRRRFASSACKPCSLNVGHLRNTSFLNITGNGREGAPPAGTRAGRALQVAGRRRVAEAPKPPVG